MLQEPSYDAADVDIVRQSWPLRYQAGNAPDDHINPHSCLSGSVQGINHLAVCQGIHFQQDICLLAILRLFNFSLNQIQQGGFQICRCHQQLLVFTHKIADTHIPEEHGAIPANGIISGQQGKIRIQLGCLGIEIACANVGNILYPLLLWLPIGNLAQLGMNLVAIKAVEDLAAGFPEAIDPANIVFLVKACLQLQQHRYILAHFRCHHQVVHQLYMTLAYPIDGNADGQHIGAVHRFLDKLQQNAEIIIRVAQENIPLLYQISQCLPFSQVELFLYSHRSIWAIIQLLL